jgi:hypothetical protein
MVPLVLAVLAPIGAWIHLHRRPDPHGRARTLEVYLLWWLALAIGVASALAAAEHVFNGAQTAAMIGFTRGDGGFQFENAMGDLSIGVVGLLCLRIRGTFWLAVLVVTAVQYYGDMVGHLYQWLANGNTHSGNIGPPLAVDIIVPTVGICLYAAWRRAAGVRETLDPALAKPSRT